MYSGKAVIGLLDDTAEFGKAGHPRPNGFIADAGFDVNAIAILIS